LAFLSIGGFSIHHAKAETGHVHCSVNEGNDVEIHFGNTPMVTSYGSIDEPPLEGEIDFGSADGGIYIPATSLDTDCNSGSSWQFFGNIPADAIHERGESDTGQGFLTMTAPYTILGISVDVNTTGLTVDSPCGIVAGSHTVYDSDPARGPDSSLSTSLQFHCDQDGDLEFNGDENGKQAWYDIWYVPYDTRDTMNNMTDPFVLVFLGISLWLIIVGVIIWLILKFK